MLMLTGKISDPANRQLLLNKMAQSHGIVDLRILRGNPVKQQFGEGLPEEQAVDEIDREVLTNGKTIFRIVTARTGRPALRVVTPFIAKQEFRGTNCLSCHNVPVGAINGAASVIIDLSEDEEKLKEIEDWLWIGNAVLQLLMYLIIAKFVSVVIERNITRPVKMLQSAMTDIQQNMDLSKRAEVDANNPDIGEMAKSFNLLVEGLEDATERLQLFATIFENSGEAIFITDAQKNILAVNPAFIEITGYSAEDVTGKSPQVFSSAEQSLEFYEEMWALLEVEGEWHGEIWNRRKSGEIYPEWLILGLVKNDKDEVINYIALFSDISKRKETEQRIEFLAHYDALTKLPNRTLFADRFSQTLLTDSRNSKKTALLFLDLDKFKSINDTLGHLVGDRLLQSVAGRLKACVRESDTICRHGGDEFMILLAGINDAHDAEMVAHKIGVVMSEPHQLGKETLNVTFSIGISICPDDATDEETLIHLADEAMYQAKARGRNNYQFFKQT
jgi:diguanylate cyclase (GGDEF)-like protein/PAS domain S-box-containing protein